VAAHEHKAQRIVADLVLAISGCRRPGRVLFQEGSNGALFRQRHALMAQGVARQVHGHAGDPRGRVLRHTADGPGAHGLQQRALRHILRQRQIPRTYQADERAVQPPCFMTEEVLDHLRSAGGDGRCLGW
jgi:hypothetical protein